jgi:HEAT repeat protein
VFRLLFSRTGLTGLTCRTLCALVCSAVSALAQSAPPLDALVLQLASTDLHQRREAVYEIAKLGPSAKPALPALLKAADDPDKQVWTGALGIIADLGPQAKDVVPDLIERLDPGKSRQGRERDRNQAFLRFSYALAQIGPDAVPALSQALEGESVPRRIGATRALAQIGAAAKPAVPAMLKNLAHWDDTLRRDTADALAQMGEVAVPGLMEGLGAKEPKQRQAAALALSQLGPQAKSAAPALLAAAEKETDDLPRGAILTALTKTGADPARTAPLLLKAVRGENAELRHAALNALLTSPTVAKTAVATLTTELQSKDKDARQRGAQLLARLGPAAAPAVPALIERAKAEPAEALYTTALAEIGPRALPPLMEALSNKSGGDRKWVFRALSEMGAPAMTGLTDALRSPTASVRAGAATALEGMPLEKHPAVKLLLGLADDKDPQVRSAALKTLADVRSDRPAIIPKLEAALNDRDSGVQKAAAIGLASAGAVEKVGANGLIALLNEPYVNTRRAAAQSLAGFGEKAKPAVPALLKLLADPALSATAVETVGRIGPAASEAVPKLVEYAKNGDGSAKSVSFAAFGNIGPSAASALPVMYAALKENEEVMLPALHAIARVETDDTKLFGLFDELIHRNTRGRIRRAVAEEYKRLGDRSQKAQSAVPVLLSMLDIPTERSEAINAMRAIRPTDVAALQKLLDHKEATVRAFGCDALAKLGPEAAPALPKLQEKLKDSDDRVRQQAKKALSAVEKK